MNLKEAALFIQGVTMDGWTVGLAKEDIICVPAAIAFGFTDAADPSLSLAGLFHEIAFCNSDDLARKETSSMSRLKMEKYRDCNGPDGKGLF